MDLGLSRTSLALSKGFSIRPLTVLELRRQKLELQLLEMADKEGIGKFAHRKSSDTYAAVEVMLRLEHLATGGKPLLSSTSEKDTRTECKTIYIAAVDVLGSNVDMKEPKEDPKEEMIQVKI
ncbi:hypothetical protein DITRI_Ditri07aG0045800 [Diplodiscus trichospermus]